MDEKNMKELISRYLSEGKKLTEIQDILSKEHGVKLTFMELRILASELENVDWNKFTEKEDKNREKELSGEAKQGERQDKEETNSGFTGTTVEINKIARPGSVMSGSVKFSSGATAEWVFDQFGRIALEKKSGEPTQQDLQEFQLELQKVLTGAAQ